MDLSIIIGLSYKGDEDDRNRLPGSHADIYMAYKKALSMNSEKIYVITDINKNPRPSKYKEKIINGDMGDDILSLVTDLKERGHYVEHRNKNKTMSLIKKLCSKYKRIFVYISCHGISGKILLPGMELVEPEELRNSLIPKCNPNASCFVIVDCCEFGGLSLPFVFRNGDYRTNNLSCPVHSKMVLFSSSRRKDKSVSRKHGSEFTTKIMPMLDVPMPIRTIINNIDCPIHVYSTFPEQKLWSYVYGYKLNITIEDNCIKIERN